MNELEKEQPIKIMQLYRYIEQKVNNELSTLGVAEQSSIKVEDITYFDIFHYWGTDAVIGSVIYVVN